MSQLGQTRSSDDVPSHVSFSPDRDRIADIPALRIWADFVAEFILEGRVGWIDDFLRSMQSQLSRQPHTERPF